MSAEAKCWVLLSRSIPHFLLANHLVVCTTAKRQDLWKKRARGLRRARRVFRDYAAMTFVSPQPGLSARISSLKSIFQCQDVDFFLLFCQKDGAERKLDDFLVRHQHWR